MIERHLVDDFRVGIRIVKNEILDPALGFGNMANVDAAAHYIRRRPDCSRHWP